MWMEDQILEALPIPKDFCCPITHDVMEDPVVIADGHTFERYAIGEWFRRQDGVATSPLTNLELPHRLMVPNHALKKAIDAWRSERPEIVRRKISDEDLQLAIRTREEDLFSKSAGTFVGEEFTRLSGEIERLRNLVKEQDARMSAEKEQRQLQKEWDEKYRIPILQHFSVVDCFDLLEDHLDSLESLCGEAAREWRKIDPDKLHYEDVYWLFWAASFIIYMRRRKDNLDWQFENDQFTKSGGFLLEDRKNNCSNCFVDLHLLTFLHRVNDHYDFWKTHHQMRNNWPVFCNLPHIKKHIDKLVSTMEQP